MFDGVRVRVCLEGGPSERDGMQRGRGIKYEIEGRAGAGRET